MFFLIKKKNQLNHSCILSKGTGTVVVGNGNRLNSVMPVEIVQQTSTLRLVMEL